MGTSARRPLFLLSRAAPAGWLILCSSLPPEGPGYAFPVSSARPPESYHPRPGGARAIAVDEVQRFLQERFRRRPADRGLLPWKGWGGSRFAGGAAG